MVRRTHFPVSALSICRPNGDGSRLGQFNYVKNFSSFRHMSALGQKRTSRLLLARPQSVLFALPPGWAETGSILMFAPMKCLAAITRNIHSIEFFLQTLANEGSDPFLILNQQDSHMLCVCYNCTPQRVLIIYNGLIILPAACARCAGWLGSSAAQSDIGLAERA